MFNADFRINYYFDRNGQTFVNLTRKGRNYERPCKLMGDGTPMFRFLGHLWYESNKFFVPYGLHEEV